MYILHLACAVSILGREPNLNRGAYIHIYRTISQLVKLSGCEWAD